MICFNRFYVNIDIVRVILKRSFKNMSESLNIKSFIFFDIETTGLPCYENNKTRITELSMVAVEADHLRLGVFPRVQNKINFCFNPWKLISFESEKMTKLTNHLLEHQLSFTSETVDVINGFLKHNQQPVCLVAHNGNKFDFPIFQSEIKKTNSALLDGTYCIDSLNIFKNLYVNDTVHSQVPVEFTNNYDKLLVNACEGDMSITAAMAQKLNENTPVKQTIPSKRPRVDSSRQQLFKEKVQHFAEADVQTLITCAATLGDSFVDWANGNAVRFCDILPMTPGKKIGT